MDVSEKSDTIWPNNGPTPLTGLSDHVDFDLLDEPLASDIMKSLKAAIDGGAVFAAPPDPLAIFRQALLSSIRQIEEDQKRFALFVRFLRDGPYYQRGDIPPEVASQFLTDDETRQAIRYIYHRVVNTFQGALAELLAVGPCVNLFHDLQREGRIYSKARMYVGDTTMLLAGTSERWAKGPDISFLAPTKPNKMHFEGVAEVKSYALSQKRLEGQMLHQVLRAKRGILLRNEGGGYDKVPVDVERGEGPVRVGVVPATWRLPRDFRREDVDGDRCEFLYPSLDLSDKADRLEKIGPSSWRITLRWSHEALASAAYNMTFWLMGKIGGHAYCEKQPPEWDGMSTDEAGRNAAKMMLYYAILRSRSVKEDGPAIALYNAYGFGYALGANFKDQSGQRQMLWRQDLDEIALSGVTNKGYSFYK